MVWFDEFGFIKPTNNWLIDFSWFDGEHSAPGLPYLCRSSFRCTVARHGLASAHLPPAPAAGAGGGLLVARGTSALRGGLGTRCLGDPGGGAWGFLGENRGTNYRKTIGKWEFHGIYSWFFIVKLVYNSNFTRTYGRYTDLVNGIINQQR